MGEHFFSTPNAKMHFSQITPYSTPPSENPGASISLTALEGLFTPLIGEAQRQSRAAKIANFLPLKDVSQK